ncbi:MAG: TolC family protein [Bacillota bacterium]|jgi:outer membrane protein TolC
MVYKKICGVFVIALLSLSIPVWAGENSQTITKSEILSLPQCLDFAFQNNKQIQEKEKKVAIAEAAAQEAKAGFWPVVNYQVERDQSNVAQYEVGPAYEKTELTAGVVASLPLYTGGILQDNLKLTRIRLNSAREELRKARQQLAFEVKQAYYNLWLAEQIAQVQQASYQNMDRHVTRVAARYKNETASKLEVLRAKVQRDTLKPKVINAKNQVVLAKLKLATIMEYPQDKSYDVRYNAAELEMPEAVNRALEEVLDEAYQNRPELRQLQQMAEMKKILTAMEAASFKPNVALQVGYGGSNKDISLNDWYDAWSLTFSIGGKIYDRKVQAKIEQAKGEAEVTAIQEADLRDQIRFDAQQSLQNLEVSIENTRANQGSIDLAKESLRMTAIKVDNGMATTMDLMDDQLALDQALTGYYQGIVSYLVAEAKLELVVGKN